MIQVEGNVQELAKKLLQTDYEASFLRRNYYSQACHPFFLSLSLSFFFHPSFPSSTLSLSGLPPSLTPAPSLTLSPSFLFLQDWTSSDPPESDNQGHFYTAVGIMLFEMIDQNVSPSCVFSSQAGHTRAFVSHLVVSCTDQCPGHAGNGDKGQSTQDLSQGPGELSSKVQR